MAFCNSCGAAIEANGKFCPSCGKPAATAGAAVVPPATPGAPKSGGGALKIILIIVAVLVVIGIIGMAGVTYVGYKIAKGVHRDGNKTRVETPFGTVETNQDPQEIARRTGVDVYPGAKALAGGVVSSTIGGAKTVAANLETEDSVDQVAEFYRSRFPNAQVSQGGGDRYNIVAGDEHRMTTIGIVGMGGKTHISLAVVTRGSDQPTQ
jgi:RNA polymerase subunit RPABC4/transcription elongation factor Spt4